MTATQFTGGSYKHTDPSNYSTGKTGAEVTIHWSVRDGADGDEQTRIGELARIEAIRLAMGADSPPYPMPASVPAASPATNVVQMPVAPVAQAAPTPVATPATVQQPEPTAQPGPIATTAVSPTEAAGPLALSAPGPIAAPAAASPATPASPLTAIDAAPALITDEALKDAAMHHQARILNAVPNDDKVLRELAARKISELIAMYVKPPATLYSIGQELRQQFLDRLAVL